MKPSGFLEEISCSEEATVGVESNDCWLRVAAVPREHRNLRPKSDSTGGVICVDDGADDGQVRRRI